MKLLVEAVLPNRIEQIKVKWNLRWHWHEWSYFTHLYRACEVCGVLQKRTPGYFFGTDASKFEALWVTFKGSPLEFITEATRYAAVLDKCWLHRDPAEKARFGKWAIYNETVIRQNRAFPHYGICVLWEPELFELSRLLKHG
jgi:hypothetical protein